MKSKSTTALLAFFLGGLGIHRFYLGQNVMGILYLVFCWTFIPALIALFDFFVFIFMSESRFNYKYNLKTGF
ncbi:TM2 domain-containing protein [Chryseobacterium capnotolerans]|uniref:TM2 domain-containing protein n=1 Tax=Chryseobacterium TaxID=59732 RepID=UPI00083B0C28|nr:MULTISPECIES: TM2 domain-containing protein [Chryseobacterium]UHO38416.1 TM2 domain-containing protein [Chryseobacterium capnotolerans]